MKHRTKHMLIFFPVYHKENNSAKFEISVGAFSLAHALFHVTPEY